MYERLQKYMAECGIASRRKCEEYIQGRRVKVNGKIIDKLGFKVDTESDTIYFDNKKIEKEIKKLYIALNKPVGYISSVKDDRGRKTILDIVKVDYRIYPIGRLDYDTSGLILLTNDGDVYNNIIHPRVHINKVYIALIKGVPDENEIYKFKTGIDIGDYITSDAEFKILERIDNNCKVKITIHEGKNRQIRRMCDAIGHPVISLKRISIGKITIEGIKTGKWRNLSKNEIKYLKNELNVDKDFIK